ncbi:MAG: hypothetical protein ACRDST_19120 [Pseudonocardiaceae bacterium]
MPGPPLDTEAKDDTGGDARTPPWVRAFGIIAFVLVLLFVILLLSGRGHGPGRHTPSGGGDTLGAGVTASGAGGGHNPSDRGH